jgi:hypothetical protein
MYQISKEIYGIKDGFGRPQKLYKYRDLLKKEGALIEKISPKPKWESTPKPVVEEIDRITTDKDLKLEYFEKKLLTKILNSSFFRKYLSAYPKNISGEFDGMEIILQTFDLWLLQKNNWMKENIKRYRKATSFPPYPRNQDEAKIYVKEFEKMQNIKKSKILKETKKEIKRYRETQEILQPHGLTFDEVVDDVFNKPKGWGYDSFLYPQLIFKLIMNKENKWSSLSSMGKLFNDIIFQTHASKDIGAFLLPKALEIMRYKKK